MARVEKRIWVYLRPDDGAYSEQYARETIAIYEKLLEVNVEETSQSRDTGHGYEKLFIVSGTPEAVEEFLNTLDEVERIYFTESEV